MMNDCPEISKTRCAHMQQGYFYGSVISVTISSSGTGVIEFEWFLRAPDPAPLLLVAAGCVFCSNWELHGEAPCKSYWDLHGEAPCKSNWELHGEPPRVIPFGNYTELPVII